MNATFAVAKRELASNKMSFILTVLVVLCATTSGDSAIALSNGNYTWLLAAMSPFFFVFYVYPKLMYLGASKKDFYAGSLVCYGFLALSQYDNPPYIRPTKPYTNRDESDGSMWLDGKWCFYSFPPAGDLSLSHHDFSSCASVHAVPLVWLVDRRHIGSNDLYFYANCSSASTLVRILSNDHAE